MLLPTGPLIATPPTAGASKVLAGLDEVVREVEDVAAEKEVVDHATSDAHDDPDLLRASQSCLKKEEEECVDI